MYSNFRTLFSSIASKLFLLTLISIFSQESKAQVIKTIDDEVENNDDYTTHFRVITPENLMCTTREVVVCHDTKPDSIEHFAIRIYLRRTGSPAIETWETVPFEGCQNVYVLSGGGYELKVQCLDSEFPNVPKAGELLKEYNYYFSADDPGPDLASRFEFNHLLYTCDFEDQYNIIWDFQPAGECISIEHRFLILGSVPNSNSIDTIYIGPWEEGCPEEETSVDFSTIYEKLERVEEFWPVLEMNSYDCMKFQHGLKASILELVEDDPPSDYTFFLCKDTAAAYELTREDLADDPYLTTDLIEWSWSDGEYLLFRDFENFGYYSLVIRTACSIFEYDFEIQEGECDDFSNGSIQEPFQMYLPNAFSPNGDGINDVFQAYGNGFQPKDLRIFDRYGSLIFQGRDEDCKWSGQNSGNRADFQPNVFVYIFTYLDHNGREQIAQGEVVLLK